MRYHTIVKKASLESITKGADLLRKGKLVVFPTETVYGIGANALNEVAVENIFTAKGRPQDNPIIVHISDYSQLKNLVTEISEDAKKLAKAFWPGPLTIILPKSSTVPEITSGGLDSVAVRMPNHPVALELIKQCGLPIAAPSANRSGAPSPTSAQHVIDDLFGRVDFIIDGGPCQVGVESTVVSLLDDIPVILRPGAVTLEDIFGTLGKGIMSDAILTPIPKNQEVLSPGLKYKHYAPKANVVLIHGTTEEFSDYVNDRINPGYWAMAFKEDLPSLKMPVLTYGNIGSPSSQAEQLFETLRGLDEKGAKEIYVHAPPLDGIGLAVYNRLLRAASFQEHYCK